MIKFKISDLAFPVISDPFKVDRGSEHFIKNTPVCRMTVPQRAYAVFNKRYLTVQRVGFGYSLAVYVIRLNSEQFTWEVSQCFVAVFRDNDRFTD